MTKSSAAVSENSGNLRSTPRTQKPSRFRRLTRWLPMNPPAPQTSTLFITPLSARNLRAYRLDTVNKSIACHDPNNGRRTRSIRRTPEALELLQQSIDVIEFFLGAAAFAGPATQFLQDGSCARQIRGGRQPDAIAEIRAVAL